MKLHASPGIWTHRVWSDDGVTIEENRPATRDTSAAWAECELVVTQRPASGNLSTPMQIVGILAFCQAIFFLALFLFLCARAGAAPESKPESRLALTPSTYTTETVRDPFGAEVPKMSGTAAGDSARAAGAESFKLMGILYNAASPSALVNNQLVELNKPAMVRTGQGEVEVKAVTITRDLVVLEVGGQKMELRLGGTTHDQGSK
jgi:hypothetical protein